MASEVSLGKGENKPLLHAMPGQSHIEVKVIRSDGPPDRVSGKTLLNKYNSVCLGGAVLKSVVLFKKNFDYKKFFKNYEFSINFCKYAA